MKKIYIKKFRIIVLVVCVMVNITGCSHAGNVKDQDLGEDLACFIEYSESGDTLKGVRRLSDGQIIVTPALYLSITADSCLVVASKGDFSHEVWKTDGTRIGKFDTFTGFKRGCYVGTRYRITCYYFPRYDLLLCSDQVRQGKHGICIKVDGRWQVRAYDGKLLWEGDDQPAQEDWDHTYGTEFILNMQ